MYSFRDTWYGDVFEFPTLRKAKREAQKMTCGHCIQIYKEGEIVAVVKPKENPLP